MVDESVWSTAVPVQVERETETERKGEERQRKTVREQGDSQMQVYL